MLTKSEFDALINNPSEENRAAAFNSLHLNIDYLDSSLIPIIANQININDKERIIADLYTRIRLWVHSVILMNNKLCFQGVATATRSIFELYIDMHIIDRDSSGLYLKKYTAYSDIDRYHNAQRLIQYQDKHPGSKVGDLVKHFLGQLNKEDIISTIQNTWGITEGKNGKIKYPVHWSGNNLRKRAEDLGAKYEELYLKVYPRMSFFIHSVPTGFERINDFSNTNLLIYCYLTITEMLIEATKIIGRTFKITEFDLMFLSKIDNLKYTAIKLLINKHTENK